MKSIITAVSGWVEERVDLSGVKEFIAHKSVPKNRHSIWYYFGGVTLFLFIVQVISGILLLFYYRPGADTAFESIRFLMTKVQFGWLMRSVHSWSANLMVLAAAVHMFSVFLTKAYRKPREMTWVSGMLLFFLSLGFGFSGYLLPWNELAFFATKVGTDIAGSVPVVGHPIMELLRGGPDVGGATLSRFFGFHVALFPAIFTVLLTVHLLLVQKQGMSSPIGAAEHGEEKTMPFFPNFVLRDLLLWLIVLNILAILAVFFPWELGVKADPFAAAPAGILPEWYFLFMFQILKLLPAHIWFIEGEVFGILFFGVAGLLWVLVPFWDRASQRGENNRWFTYLGIFVIVFILFFTILGWVM
ncbi:MAG: cytochrome bc complex cytochrome b subunit [Bacteroidetes bacterium]|nr:cytochrome bc complex cytochrome b subunit [Bacteroidota bacterium]